MFLYITIQFTNKFSEFEAAKETHIINRFIESQYATCHQTISLYILLYIPPVSVPSYSTSLLLLSIVVERFLFLELRCWLSTWDFPAIKEICNVCYHTLELNTLIPILLLFFPPQKNLPCITTRIRLYLQIINIICLSFRCNSTLLVYYYFR